VVVWVVLLEVQHHKTTLVLVEVVELEVQDLTLKLLDSSVTQKELEVKGFNLQLLEGQLFMLQVE
jgi:hypothetical protein